VNTPVEVAIVGAGPYGLSLAAHLAAARVETHIFGRPMDSWLSHMPEGMLLKSDPFASNLSDPQDSFTLARFSEERSIPHSETEPVRVLTEREWSAASFSGLHVQPGWVGDR
jgi:cation diffusion facilitator CzcD-associated flavoprotein CzcO